MNDTPNDWIDLLSIPIVEYTASVWGKSPSETWGILSRAIQREEISQHLPLYEYIDYICVITENDPDNLTITPDALGVDYKQIFDYYIERLGWRASRKEILEFFQSDYKTVCEHLSKRHRTPTSLQVPFLDETHPKVNADILTKDVEPYRVPPPTLERRLKKIFDNVAWQPIVIVLCVIFTLIAFSTHNSKNLPAPAPTFNSTVWESTVTGMRTSRACEEDAMAGVPLEYSRCNPSAQAELPDEPYYFDEEIEGTPAPCLIKGNISFETGEKIYHLPGQSFTTLLSLTLPKVNAGFARKLKHKLRAGANPANSLSCMEFLVA